MNASTQTESYHLLGRADVSVQTNTAEQSFVRKRLRGPRIVIGKRWQPSMNKKHPRKRGMTVSLAATHIAASPAQHTMSSVGTSPERDDGFQEALLEALDGIRTATLSKPPPQEDEDTKPTKSRHVLIQEKVEAQLANVNRPSRPQIRRIKRIPPSQVATTIKKRLEKNKI